MNLVFRRWPALIGMVHLEALPGAPGFQGDLSVVVQRAVADARILAETGFDGIMVENFHDTPFFKERLPPISIAALTRCALAVRQATGELPLGINVLRNDGEAALGIACAVGAQFIRVNVLVGAMVTDQGLIEGRAAELLRLRAALGAPISIMADLMVKHAQAISPPDLLQLAQDTAFRGHADALILSGSGTGQPTDPAQLKQLQGVIERPLFIGSGINAENLSAYPGAGFIVGSALKRGERVNREACLEIRTATPKGPS